MSLMNEFPVVSSNLKAGYGVFGTADPYNANLPNYGALNPPGSLWFIPAPSQSGTALPSVAGYGSGLWVKYVLYKAASAPTMVGGPAPVYYTDKTISIVSGKFSEGFVSSGLSVDAAGWLLPNTGSVAGVGVGSAVSATIMNNGGLGSWVFIGLAGLIPSAYLAAGSAGQRVYGSGDFATTGVTADGSTTYSDFKFLGTIINVSSNIGDVLCDTLIPF